MIAERERLESVSPIPWVVTAVGAAAAGAGIVFAVLSDQAQDDAVADPIQASAFDSAQRGEDYVTVANVLFVSGGVIAAAGIAWLLAELL